ncbi:MAG: TonB-dependent receptor [Flavobacterium sp.]|nr:MAG: TonB-dependent receptor [Flavobacterium sp.]
MKYSLHKDVRVLKIGDRSFLFFKHYCLLFTIMLITVVANAQQAEKLTVIGTVVDSSGQGVPAASVTSDNKSKVGTQTDINGKFILEVQLGAIIKIRSIGFIEKTVLVTATTKSISILLEEDKTGLNEVVITALGQTQKKEAIVGAVTSVRPGDLKIPASNLTNALAGKVSGIIGFQPSGQPGQDNSNFFIRGVTTFGYRKEPLILIDNVEMTPSDLARLQVDDIESFSVLKDASATALYGARGGNGVILVKTKEGKVGKAQISVRFENSISESANTLELADPITYMNLFNEATITRNPLMPRPYSANKILNTEATLKGAPGSNPYMYPAVDWLDMLFKKRTNTERTNINVSGGGGVARYYIAGSFANDNGILKEDSRNNNNSNVNFKNYQLRSNININLTESTELVVRLSGNFNEYKGPMTSDASFSTDLFNLATHTSPVDFPAYYLPDAANINTKHILFGNEPEGVTKNLRFVNPYAQLLRGNKNFSESRMLAQFELNQGLGFLTEGLNFRSIFSTNRYARFESTLAYAPFYYNVSNYDRLTNEYTLNWINSDPDQAREYLQYYGNDANNVNKQNTFLYMQGSLDYNKGFGKGHNISAALVGTMQQLLDGTPNSEYNSILFNSLPFRNMTLAGRATYSYNSKYYLEFNFGQNGSERFADNNRYGFFPTIGASWIVSSEKFYGNIANVIDRFKLRASYGLVGNDAISNRRFFYLSEVNLNNGGNGASFGTNNTYSRDGVSINKYENRDVSWEVSRQLNLGAELTFLKDFRIIGEVFRNIKSDILQTRSDIPTTMGLEAGIDANIGKVESEGFELSIDGRRTINNNLWISTMGNITLAKNKFLQYEEPTYNEAYRYTVGQPLDRTRGFIAERLFVDDNEARNSPSQIFSTGGFAPMGGDIKYRDLNGDGVINFEDQTFIGYPTVPQIVYGFGLSSGFKGFDLSVFFQGQARVSFMIDPARTSPFIQSPDAYYTGNTQLIKDYADNHWSENNQDLYALYPRLGINGAQIENNRQSSTWWLRDGSFLRLKSLEFGYSVPEKLLSRVKIKKMRIYFNGLNLLTWSPFDMWDPELRGTGFNYPIQKVFNAINHNRLLVLP